VITGIILFLQRLILKRLKVGRTVLERSDMKYPCGSEWRKWDLHIHTPESILNNGFGNDWDSYVKNLFSKAIERNISVIGITDYFHIERYKKVLSYINDEDKLLQLFDNDHNKVNDIRNILILPDIEFRLDKIIHHENMTKRLTMHVLFSSDEHLSIRDIEEHFYTI
jgi:PHP family Zn ribbon phosphoesterase